MDNENRSGEIFQLEEENNHLRFSPEELFDINKHNTAGDPRASYKNLPAVSFTYLHTNLNSAFANHFDCIQKKIHQLIIHWIIKPKFTLKNF